MVQTVSVIIPTYNYGRFLREAIESALLQTFAPLEIIVIDDGSTDNTAEVIKVFGERIRYVKQENAGVCIARNHGVLRSEGEFIAFLDADDIWEPTKIEKQYAKFIEDQEVGLVHCGMREFDGKTGETIEFSVEGDEGWVANELLLWERTSVITSGSAIMVRRKAFADVGGFDAKLKVGEDWDFCYRIALRYKVGFVSEPLVNYRIHGESAHYNVREMERGMRLFYSKAFANGGDVLKLKRRALGNFHRVLAGSYFQVGDYGQFLLHATRSLVYRPSNLRYFLDFPRRRLKRI